VLDGILYIATFIEDKSPSGTSEQLCETKGNTRTDGESRIYILDLANGRPIWPDEEGRKYFTLNHAKITGITLSLQGKKKHVFFTYDKMTDDGDPLDLGRLAGHSQHLEEANSIYIPPPAAGGPLNLKEGENVLQYWFKH
jgi:hypothetical protein